MQVTKYSKLASNQSMQTLIGFVEFHQDEHDSFAHHQPCAFDLGPRTRDWKAHHGQSPIQSQHNRPSIHRPPHLTWRPKQGLDWIWPDHPLQSSHRTKFDKIQLPLMKLSDAGIRLKWTWFDHLHIKSYPEHERLFESPTWSSYGRLRTR